MMNTTDASATRRQQIVTAATGIFLRYGYARTTIGDIALAAGISRPTLYQAFADKEQIFDAVIRGLVAVKIEQIRQSLPAQPGLAAQLRHACIAWGVEGFELVCNNPDAKDMFDLNFAAVRDSYGVFAGLVADILRPHWPTGQGAVPLAEAARVVSVSIKGFKDLSADSAELRQLIAAMTDIVAARVDASH